MKDGDAEAAYTEAEIASAQAEAMRTVPLPQVVEETRRILRRRRGQPARKPKANAKFVKGIHDRRRRAAR